MIIIDEFADLMMTAPDETEEKVIRIAQKARATGIHLVVATQKPIVKVITGLIKGNLPTSIALKTKTEVDSRVILDQGGAECLLGNGDMLYLPPDSSEPIRVQGAYMTDAESEAIIARWQTNSELREQEHTALETRAVISVSASSETLSVDTLVGWLTTGRINSEQFLRLMDKVSGRVTDELEDSNVTVTSFSATPQTSPKNAEFEDVTVTSPARDGVPEPALEQGGAGQNGDVILPASWTKMKLDMLPGFYRVLGNLDKSLEAVEISVTQRNRDFARDVLKQQGLWKEK